MPRWHEHPDLQIRPLHGRLQSFFPEVASLDTMAEGTIPPEATSRCSRSLSSLLCKCSYPPTRIYHPNCRCRDRRIKTIRAQLSLAHLPRFLLRTSVYHPPMHISSPRYRSPVLVSHVMKILKLAHVSVIFVSRTPFYSSLTVSPSGSS